MVESQKKRGAHQLRSSVLDRLLDEEPDKKDERERGRHQVLSELRESVRRDLESLLATRFRCVSAPKACPELESSLINYGLPDLTVINFLNSRGNDAFCQLLEDHISTYEPRFKSVNVQIIETDNVLDNRVRFRIEALMYADPAPEELVFDSSLSPLSNSVIIESMR